MKQTAVEWLIQEINKINVSTEARIFINKLKEQAKAMEKEQIKNSYHSGAIDGFNSRTVPTNPNPEQYYNETFKSE